MKLISFVLSLALVIGTFQATTFAADDSEDTLTEGNWVYSLDSSGNALLLWGDGSEKSENVVMLPAMLGGYSVTAMGDGSENVLSNNKIEDNFVLIPTSIETINARSIYDYNDTAGWVFPDSISDISENSMLSCQGGTYYIAKDSAAEDYVINADKSYSYLDSSNSQSFTISSGDNGYIQPNGTYELPTQMLDGSYSKNISVVADIGYKIASVTIDGEDYDFLDGEDKQNSISFDYTFSKSSTSIDVSFEVDIEDTRTEDVTSDSYEAPEINEGAVAEGATLPDDLNDYAAINTGTTSKYLNTVGVSTGSYYAADGKLYKMVYSSQTSDSPEYYSKAEVINGVYADEGLVYGDDYDYIRLYNYDEEVSSGPSTGEVALYCTYLYKIADTSDIDTDNVGTVYVDNDQTNTAAIFAQEGADVTLTDLTADVYTSSRGPSEAGNFFGLGSAIHVDGGDVSTAASNQVNEDTASVHLINPQVLGTVNSIYSLASGVIDIDGGNIFSCTSGGHGPYVSTGGQILLNTDGTNLIDSDGNVNEDTSSLTATTRPTSDIASMGRSDSGDMEGIYQDHDDDVTAIVTGDEAGTALATDTGGGMIVANQVTTKTYGLRCAGVYSIGFDESWVYTFNSTLSSGLDAGLCSASGGFIYAYNTDITGVMGIKVRAGGNTDSDETGVTVINSRVAAYYDSDEMKSVYDVADPDDWDDSMADATTSTDQLNIFIDKANSPTFNEDSLDWWFMDKSKTPGYSGGNKFAVIYVENSSTPINIDSSYLVNQNYLEYGTLSDEAIAQGQTPADNLLVSVESGGTGNINFTNENSDTSWDLTGVDTKTTALNGDFYVGESSDSSDDPNLGSGSNTINANFTNSEWTGSILRGDDSGVVNLTFDDDSTWTVSDDSIISDLSLASEDCITAENPVTVTIAGTLTIGDSIVTDTSLVLGNVTLLLDSSAINAVSGSSNSMGSGDMGDMTPPDGSGDMGDMTPPDGSGDMGDMTPPDGSGDMGDMTPPDGSIFTDLQDTDSTYTQAIQALQEQEILLGTGQNTFLPEETMTRADFLLMLSRAFDWPSSSNTSFTDISSDDYYYSAIASAEAAGIVDTSQDDFSPTDSITLGQGALWLYNALLANGQSFDLPSSDTISAYVDSDDVSDDILIALTTLIQSNILNVEDVPYNSTDTMTREEAALLLYNALN